MAADCPRCRDEIARLEEENASLRRTALTLGSIAERLNLALREERRSNHGTRQELARSTGSDMTHGSGSYTASPAERFGKNS